jgi:hypothetical protein
MYTPRMFQGILRTVLCIALACLFSGCQQAASQPSANWPVPGLTLPPGAVLLKAVEPKTSGGASPSTMWTAGIRYGKAWPALVAHVEGCLQRLDYSECIVDSPQLGGRGFARDYYSPDRLTRVSIINMDKPSRAGQPDKANFAIMVFVTTAPDPLVEKATADPGGAVRLEPLK